MAPDIFQSKHQKFPIGGKVKRSRIMCLCGLTSTGISEAPHVCTFCSHVQLSKKFPGVTSLRGVTMEQLDAVKATLDPVDYRCGHGRFVSVMCRCGITWKPRGNLF